MPKITVNVMPTASNAQPALYRFLALARISSAGVISALPNICRNQPGIPAAAESLCRLVDAIVRGIHRSTTHTIGAVANVLASALKAMGKRIGHGIAKGAQLGFQLLLHLTAIGLFFCIVFTIVHQNFLTLLPVHTG